MLVSLIPQSRFEAIRDAIGRVLTAELANQKKLTINGTWKDINIFLERTDPIDKSELPAINIIYTGTDFNNENTSYTSVGDSKYLVEIYTNSENGENLDGDCAAALLLAKIAGIIRSILMQQSYYYLDFTEKFIQSRRVMSIVRTTPRTAADSLNTIAGVLEAHYFAEETTELGTGELVGTLSTVVKLSDTEKGFKYEINT